MAGALEATALPPSALFGRQTTCPKDFFRCSNITAFCCPNNHSCLALAGNTTLLCCPVDPDTPNGGCKRIEPIICDIASQDANKTPGSFVKTLALTGALPRCQKSGQCCPFGFTCAFDGGKDVCVMDEDQSKPPAQASSTIPASSSTLRLAPSSTSSVISSATPPAVQPTATPGATTGASEGDIEPLSPSNGPSPAVIGGIAAGTIGAIILAVVVACVLVKRKSKVEKTPSLKLTRSSSSFGNIITNPIISNPIIVEGTAMRSDFTRGGPVKRGADDKLAASGLAYRPSVSVSPPGSSGTEASASASLSNTRNLTANGLRHSSVAYGVPPPYQTPPTSRGNGSSAEQLPAPRTPRQHDYREPSSVSINVFADPLSLTPESVRNTAQAAAGTRRYSNMTTFTQLMDEADLGGVARGGSFVPGTPQGPQGGSPVKR